ncbi:MAG TPA: hypothetical protein VKA46_39385 [Gemmataceae bacterium]|nr:hypothetical protein [Gemmataceae bacterium]
MRPLRVLAPLFVALLFAGRCAAADPPADRVKVTVAVILANGDGKIDDKLKCVAAEVVKMHPKLTGFHLGTTSTLSVPLGGAEKFKLVDGQEASITVKRCTQCPGRFCLEIDSKALVGEMTYSSVCGKYFPLVTGYKTKDKGDQLIIAFKVESCAGKDKK